jgi:hypothetical protein
MTMKRKQSGMTLLSFVVVLGVVGFTAYVAMRLFPMYQEYYAVKSSMKGLANEQGVADMDPGRMKELFFRRLNMNYSNSIKPADVKIERMEGGWNMSVSYEVRRPLVGNLDVVGNFSAEQAMTRRGAD